MADKGFSLADAMRGAIGSASTTNMGVSDLGTEGREQIEYLPRTALVADEKNFYSLDGIDELAASIELIGIQQPLRVRPIDGEDGLYRIVSGHRRRAALDKLALEGSRDYEQVPCIVERDSVSPAMQELRLIYANSDTRKISDADLAKQAERVTELLYQLKEEGVEFPGRMRDHVAEACKTSKTKLATLKVIREKLPEQYRAEWEGGKMSTDAAYKLARGQGEKTMMEKLTSNQSDYMAQREKDDREFLRICRKYFLAKAVNDGVPRTRGEGICELKYRFSHAVAGGGDFEYEGSPKGVKLRCARGPWIERTWTETWDALAVAAMMAARGDDA